MRMTNFIHYKNIIRNKIEVYIIKGRKAVIPAVGFGTRFLPAKKAIVKGILTIGDKPAIQFIVEEAIASGIEDSIAITGKGKRPIEEHFDVIFNWSTIYCKLEKMNY